MTTATICLDKYASAAEAATARKLVDVILARGYAISVSDGAEWTVKRSTDKDVIIEALATTGEDCIVMRNADGEKLGSFWLVYQDGEGDELIADCSANAETDSVYREVIPE